MTEQEIARKLDEISRREPEEPTKEDRLAIEAARLETESTDLEDLKTELEQYSGRIVLRIPRSLHKKLKDAAAVEGVSLNQYMLFKLSS